MSNELLDAALGYARRGWLVLPLIPGKKTPLTFGNFQHGYKDATTDEGEIRECWLKNPNANIGLRPGYESGFGVTDEDNKNEPGKEIKDGRGDIVALEKCLGALPRTFTVYTASQNKETGNRGAQYYHKFPIELRDAVLKKQLAPGVDVKMKNCYVVAPPSVVNGRAYEAGDINNDIVELPPAWVGEYIKPELTLDDWRGAGRRPRGSGPSICEEYNLHMSDVLDLSANARRTGNNNYLIKHPVHGATGDGNMSIDAGRDIWYCHRCDGRGDPLTWVAVRERFIDCADTGPLDRDTIKQCLDVLRAEGKVPEEATVRAAVTVTTKNGKEETYTVKIRPLNDVANVERFLSKYGDDIRWCEETRRWVAFNGAYWGEVSTDYVKRLARGVASIIRLESALIDKLNKSDDEKARMADKFATWARQSSFKNRIDAIIELSKADLAISVHAFTRDPLLYNCENGTFNIATGEMQPHNRDDYITHYYDESYEPESQNKKWDAFLERVQPSSEVREFLKRAAGYSLTGLTTEEALFFCYGKGSTGKSTFLDTIRNAAATYGDVSKFATFLADRNASGGSPREDITRLMGLRMVICNEVNRNTRFNSALLKTLVSGELYLARVPYSPQSVSFEPTFKLWLAANDRPKMEYDDEAAFRRFYVIPFKVVIPKKEQDTGLRNYFKRDHGARKAVLAWIIEGAVEWYKLSDGGHTDGLRAPAEVVAETEAYQLAMNPVYDFIINECAIGCDGNGLPFEVEAIRLWDVYSDARSHYDMRTVKSGVSLGKYLSSFGFESFQETTGARPRKWRYIQLLDPEKMPTQPGVVNCCRQIRTDERIKTTITETPYASDTIEKVCDFCLLIRSCVREGKGGILPVDQYALVQYFITTFEEVKNAGALAIDDLDTLLQVTSEKIKVEHIELEKYDVYAFGQRLVKEDKSAQALIADIMSR